MAWLKEYRSTGYELQALINWGGQTMLATALPGVNIVSGVAGLSQTEGSLAIRPATVDTKAAQAETV